MRLRPRLWMSEHDRGDDMVLLRQSEVALCSGQIEPWACETDPTGPKALVTSCQHQDFGCEATVLRGLSVRRLGQNSHERRGMMKEHIVWIFQHLPQCAPCEVCEKGDCEKFASNQVCARLAQSFTASRPSKTANAHGCRFIALGASTAVSISFSTVDRSIRRSV